MENGTTIRAAFQAAIRELSSQGMGNNIPAKAYTGEEDSLAETNTCNGSALLHFLVTTECDRKMRADGVICTKENITRNATEVGSKTNLSSERVVACLFHPDFIPRNSGSKPVLATIRAAFYVVNQQQPDLARRAVEVIVNMTMPQDNSPTAEEPVPWARILLPLPEQDYPSPLKPP